jgi:hypothetical protein
MKRIIFVLIVSLLTGCADTYLIATNFQDSLHQGMKKEEFINAWQSKNRKMIGATPTSSRTFSHNNDRWEVLIYSVYEYGSVRAGSPKVDHKEYVAFKNGLLEEWGSGTLPLSLQADPTVIHVESGQ